MLKNGDQAPGFSIRPIFGQPISVPVPVDTAVTPGTLVLTFVGSLASPFARRWLAAFQDNFAAFDRGGAQIAAVASCGIVDAQDFVPRYHLLYPLAADPDGAIAARYEVQRDRSLVRSVRHGLLQEVRGALSFGVGWGKGSIRTLPAVFVIRDGHIQASHYATSIADVPDIEALLQCALQP